MDTHDENGDNAKEAVEGNRIVFKTYMSVTHVTHLVTALVSATIRVSLG